MYNCRYFCVGVSAESNCAIIFVEFNKNCSAGAKKRVHISSQMQEQGIALDLRRTKCRLHGVSENIMCKGYIKINDIVHMACILMALENILLCTRDVVKIC